MASRDANMECCDLIDLLVDFLDGDLDEERTSRIQFHLDWCEPCTRFLDSYRTTGELCRKALFRQMPDDLKEELFTILRQELLAQKAQKP
jgi:anti-sigma factor RsiW